MINISNAILNMINAPVRKIGAGVELYNGSILAQSFLYTDALKSFSVERVGVEKFFGYGISHKLKLNLIDKERAINITTANSLKPKYDITGEYITPYPLFYVSEVHRDETTNELSITAYDRLYNAAAHTVAEIGLTSYTLREFAAACADLLGLTLNIEGGADTAFDTAYEDGANLDGTESIKQALNAIAEATQTIFYINSAEALTFKRLDIAGEAVLTIDREKYFSLDSKTNRRLGKIVHTTELGDNVSATTTESGSTQYIRDNPFLELREDISELLENAIEAIGGLTLNQFECTWRGNIALEPGDKISLITKDGKSVVSYLLNDTVSYNGFLEEETEWSYTDNEDETAENPSTLGEALKQTYARVDKANKQIDLLASQTEATAESVASLQLNTNSISATVQKMESSIAENAGNVNGEIAELKKQVSAKMSAEAVRLEIQTELEKGAKKVVTNTGFAFDDAGLTVSKSGSEMTTTITENGMKVYRDNAEVLTADNTGVVAVNLHAKTYLIIGANSRLEDYGSDRTGCFWIGN